MQEIHIKRKYLCPKQTIKCCVFNLCFVPTLGRNALFVAADVTIAVLLPLLLQFLLLMMRILLLLPAADDEDTPTVTCWCCYSSCCC